MTGKAKKRKYRTTADGYLVKDKVKCDSDESDGHSSSQSARRGRKDDSDSEEVLVSALAKRESPQAASSQSSAYSYKSHFSTHDDLELDDDK